MKKSMFKTDRAVCGRKSILTVHFTRKAAAAIFAAITLYLCIAPVRTLAQDGEAAGQTGRFMTAQQTVDAKAEPDENAETLFSYQAGDMVYVTGQTEDGWYIVYYQDQTGYIDAASTQGAFTAVTVDVDMLNAGMAEEEETSRLIIEETERYRAESRRSKIWGAVIVLLVLGLFATGIISTVRSEREEEKDDDAKPEAKQNRIQRKTGDPGKEARTDTGAAGQKAEDDILDLDLDQDKG